MAVWHSRHDEVTHQVMNATVLMTSWIESAVVTQLPAPIQMIWTFEVNGSIKTRFDSNSGQIGLKHVINSLSFRREQVVMNAALWYKSPMEEVQIRNGYINEILFTEWSLQPA